MKIYIIILLASLSMNVVANTPISQQKRDNSSSRTEKTNTHKSNHESEKPASKTETVPQFVNPNLSVDSIKMIKDSINVIIDSLTRRVLYYQKRDSIFSKDLMARMLYKYPLYERYDPARITYSLQLIDSLRIQQRFDKLSELMYPILTQYGKYNMELKDIIEQLITLTKLKLLTRKEIDEYINNSEYKKDCYTAARRIPYLEKIITQIYSLYDSYEGVSIEALEDIKNEL